MRTFMALASVGIALGACAQVLDLDAVVYVGVDAAPDAPEDGRADATADAALEADATPTCDAPCPPATLLVESGLEPTLATDGKNVFVRVGGEVQACSVNGCASASHVFTAGSATPRLVAASASRVYWNDGNAVFGCAGAGACGTPSTIVDLGALQLTGLAASTASSWVHAVGWSGGTLRVVRASLDGSTQTQVISQSIASSTSGAVVAVPQSTRVYWAEDGVPGIFDCASPPCASPDHATTALASSPLGLAATIASVFFGTSSGLYVADKDLATAKSFASGGVVEHVVTTTASEASVYFVEGAGAAWTLAACPTSSPTCPSPSVLHTTTTAITALAADDTSLYWIEGTAVMRLVLP